MAAISKRKGLIQNSENTEDWFTVWAEVPLNEMFGYAGELRSGTQGKGEFSMEYSRYSPCTTEVIDRVIRDYQESMGLLPVEKKKKN